MKGERVIITNSLLGQYLRMGAAVALSSLTIEATKHQRTSEFSVLNHICVPH